MPNCNFYAAVDDHRIILDWLFAEDVCDIHELGSDLDAPLKQFTSTADVLVQFDRCYPTGARRHTVHLKLDVHGAGPRFVPRRVTLNPAACGGATFRYSAEGFGLVQLYLSVLVGPRLEASHTNHFTLLGAQKWASPDELAKWDFPAITALSSRLNRMIRKRGVGRLRGAVVLPGGMAAWDGGTPLGPFVPGKHAMTRD